MSGGWNGFHRVCAALAVVVALAACDARQGQQSAEPANRYTALDAWPDWSGTWALERESARQAGSDCCSGDWSHIPFTPRYAEWRSKIVWGEVNRPKGIARNNSATCLPAGVPAVMAHPILMEFLYTPGRVTMIFNDGEIRKVDTSGAPHPPRDEIEIGFSGHSTGRWDNGVLTVDTVAIDLRADIFMSNGMKVSPAMQVVETMVLNGTDRLQVTTTLTDPEVFTRPYTYVRYFQRVPGDFNPVCAANNVDNGLTVGDPEELR